MSTSVFVAGCLTCVQVLNIMVLLGFMLNYALRVNLTIAIVEMIYDDNDNHTAALNITLGPHNVTEVRFTASSNIYCLEIIETYVVYSSIVRNGEFDRTF